MSIDNSRQISDVKVLLKTGVDGSSIASIEKTGTVGLVDTYTITLTNGEKTTFDVTNGNGIVSIAKTGTVGLVDTYTITFEDGTTTTFQVTNGSDSFAQIAERVTNPSTKAYVVGDFVIFNETFCKVIAPIASGATFAIGTNLEATTVSDEMFPRDEQRIVGSKNLLPYPYGEESDEMFSVNNGEITVSGTSSSSGNYNISNPYYQGQEFLLDKGTYRLTGGVNSNLYLRVSEDWHTHNMTGGGNDTGNGVEFTLSAKTSIQITLYLTAGATNLPVVVKPLLTLASDNDRTFARPAFTNAKLTDKVIDLDNETAENRNGIITNTRLIEKTVGWVSKNLLKNTAVGGSYSGVSVTVNADKTITLDGTNSSSSTISVIVGTVSLPAGTYRVNGLGTNGNYSRFWISLYNATDMENLLDVIGDVHDVEFTLNETKSIRYIINVAGNYEFPLEVTLSPMIRDATIIDATYAQYHESVEEVMFPRDEQIILGAKNIGAYKNYSLLGNESEGFSIATGGCSLIANLKHGINYVVQKKSGQGDRFRVVLFTDLPTTTPNRSTSQVIFDNNLTEYTFNSGNYNYAVFTYVSSTGTAIAQDTAEAMISLDGGEYVSHVMTNKELTDAVVGLNGYGIIRHSINAQTVGVNSELSFTLPRAVNYAVVIGSSLKTQYDNRAYEPFVSSYPGAGGTSITLRFNKQGTQELMAENTSVTCDVILLVKYV